MGPAVKQIWDDWLRETVYCDACEMFDVGFEHALTCCSKAQEESERRLVEVEEASSSCSSVCNITPVFDDNDDDER